MYYIPCSINDILYILLYMFNILYIIYWYILVIIN